MCLCAQAEVYDRTTLSCGLDVPVVTQRLPPGNTHHCRWRLPPKKHTHTHVYTNITHAYTHNSFRILSPLHHLDGKTPFSCNYKSSCHKQKGLLTMQSQRRRAASKTPESISEGCLTDGTLYRRLKSQNCHNYAKIEICLGLVCFS